TLVDDEGQEDARVVPRRPGDERDPARHLAVDQIGFGSSGCGFALGREDLEVVAVKGRQPIAIGPELPASLRRLGDQVAKRAPWLVSGSLPVQAVLLSWIAVERLRKQTRWLSIASLFRIIALSPHIRMASSDRRNLVPTDPARKHFFFSGSGVELPAVPPLYDGDRERPSLVADDEYFLVGSLIDQS